MNFYTLQFYNDFAGYVKIPKSRLHLQQPNLRI
jgi:hypothetical protein